MSLQHIQKNSPRLLPKPAKFEKNPPNGYRVIRKTKCGAGRAGGAGSSPIHKQASLAGRLIIKAKWQWVVRQCNLMWPIIEFNLHQMTDSKVRLNNNNVNNHKSNITQPGHTKEGFTG